MKWDPENTQDLPIDVWRRVIENAHPDVKFKLASLFKGLALCTTSRQGRINTKKLTQFDTDYRTTSQLPKKTIYCEDRNMTFQNFSIPSRDSWVWDHVVVILAHTTPRNPILASMTKRALVYGCMPVFHRLEHLEIDMFLTVNDSFDVTSLARKLKIIKIMQIYNALDVAEVRPLWCRLLDVESNIVKKLVISRVALRTGFLWDASRDCYPAFGDVKFPESVRFEECRLKVSPAPHFQYDGVKSIEFENCFCNSINIKITCAPSMKIINSFKVTRLEVIGPNPVCRLIVIDGSVGSIDIVDPIPSFTTNFDFTHYKELVWTPSAQRVSLLYPPNPETVKLVPPFLSIYRPIEEVHLNFLSKCSVVVLRSMPVCHDLSPLSDCREVQFIVDPSIRTFFNAMVSGLLQGYTRMFKTLHCSSFVLWWEDSLTWDGTFINQLGRAYTPKKGPFKITIHVGSVTVYNCPTPYLFSRYQEITVIGKFGKYHFWPQKVKNHERVISLI